MCGKSNNIGPNAELVLTWHLAYTHMLLKTVIPKAFQEKIFSPKLPVSSNKRQIIGGKLKKVNKTEALKGKNPCPNCNKKFNTLYTLKYHLAMHHFKDELLNRSGSSLHKCGICSKQYGGIGKKVENADFLLPWHLAYTHKVIQEMIPKELTNLIFCNAKVNEPASDLNGNKTNDEVDKQAQSYLELSKSDPPSSPSLKDLETSGTLSLVSGVLDNIKRSEKLQPQLVLENMKTEIEDWIAQKDGTQNVQGDTSDARNSESFKTSTQNCKSKSTGGHTCFICAGNYKTWRSLQSHLAQYHFKDELLQKSGSSPARCGICFQGFVVPGRPKSRNELIITSHLAFVHDMLKPLISHEYACNDLDTAHKAKMRAKNRSSSPDPRPITSKRKRVFLSYSGYKAHDDQIKKQVEETLPRQPCFLCTSTFKTWETLKSHLAVYHFMDDLLKESGSTAEQCGICNKHFNQQGWTRSVKDNCLARHLAFNHGLLGRLIPKYSKFRDTKQQQPVPDMSDQQQPSELKEPEQQQLGQSKLEPHQTVLPQPDEQKPPEQNGPEEQQSEPNQLDQEQPDQPDQQQSVPDQPDQLQPVPDQPHQQQPLEPNHSDKVLPWPDQQSVTVETVQVAATIKDEVTRQAVFGGGKALTSFSDLALAANMGD